MSYAINCMKISSCGRDLTRGYVSSFDDIQKRYIEEVMAVQKLTILGVTFNEKCTWADHVEDLAMRTCQRLFPIRLLKPYLDVAQLKTV